MRHSTLVFQRLMLLACLAVLPGVAQAQTGAIAGQVTDPSGAVLPGVAVEAASPALIGGTREVVTDGQGRYSIESLVPGIYRVTFSLDGFSTLVREGIELSANFTAPVSVQLRVGALEESVTVSGASPVVDVARTDSQTVMSRDALEALPTGRGWAQAGVLIPGVVAGSTDVGGTSGMHQQYLTIHGSVNTDSTPLIDGMSVGTMFASGYVVSNYLDDGAFQETVFVTGGGSAEVQSGGIAMNLIPKEGGNKFSGQGVNLYSDKHFASSNYSPELQARGLVSPGTLVRDWDYGWSLGGPVKPNKLWFFGAYRNWGVNTTVSNTFDAEGNPGVDDNELQSMLLRLTYQASQKNKIAAFYARMPRWRGHRNLAPGVDPKATVINDTFAPYDAQAKWTSTMTSKLLIEAGFSLPIHAYGLPYQPEVLPTDVAKRDLINGTLTNAACCGPQVANSYSYFHAENIVASASYVTGTHSFKAGVQHKRGYVKVLTLQNLDLVQEYQRGVPFQVTVANTPTQTEQDLNHDLGLYAQDSWRTHRLTINPGLRFDYLRASIPVQTSAAGRFVPARTLAPVDNLPNWKSWSPRIGVAYDLFGDAKTALKFSIGRYPGQEAVGFAAKYDSLTYQSDARTWTDANRDDIAQDSEIGPSRNSAFGLPAGTNTPDPDIKRPYNVMYEIEAQREILPRVSLSGGYYHRQYYNVIWTQNLATSFSDYTLIPIPDPRGNGQVVPVYNLAPAKVGQVQNFDTTSDQNTTIFSGFNAAVAMRFRGGINLLAGVDTGKTDTRTCQVPDPNSLNFCDTTGYDVPFRTQYKLSGSYPLPWAGISVSGVFQSVPGAVRMSGTIPGITYLVTRAIVPQLSVSSVNELISAPGTAYYPRNNQLDLKVTKAFYYRAVRIMPVLEAFNATNAATVTSQINVYGPTLDNVRAILFPRFFKIGAQVNF